MQADNQNQGSFGAQKIPETVQYRQLLKTRDLFGLKDSRDSSIWAATLNWESFGAQKIPEMVQTRDLLDSKIPEMVQYR